MLDDDPKIPLEEDEEDITDHNDPASKDVGLPKTSGTFYKEILHSQNSINDKIEDFEETE